jgi:hypothetical protein
MNKTLKELKKSYNASVFQRKENIIKRLKIIRLIDKFKERILKELSKEKK